MVAGSMGMVAVRAEEDGAADEAGWAGPIT